MFFFSDSETVVVISRTLLFLLKGKYSGTQIKIKNVKII